MSQHNAERRLHPRYLAPQLRVSLLSIRSKMASAGLSIEQNDTESELLTVDFNHLGMSVESHKHFNIGDVLHLALSYSDNLNEEVYCFVCNRASTATGYRCGLHFFSPTLNPDSDQKQDIYTPPKSLLAIEQTLDTVI